MCQRFHTQWHSVFVDLLASLVESLLLTQANMMESFLYHPHDPVGHWPTHPGWTHPWLEQHGEAASQLDFAKNPSNQRSLIGEIFPTRIPILRQNDFFSRWGWSTTWPYLPLTPATVPYYRWKYLCFFCRNCWADKVKAQQDHHRQYYQELNLSFVANLTDAAIHKLLSAPRDSRPGLLYIRYNKNLTWHLLVGIKF